MAEICKVNWVICPKCGWRYYIGPNLLLRKGIPAICPQCRVEFDPEENLESKKQEATKGLADRFY